MKMIELLYFKRCSTDFGHPVAFSKRNYYGTDVIFIPLTSNSNNHPGTNRVGDYSCKHSLPQCQQEVSRILWNKVTAFSLLGNWPLEGRLKVFSLFRYPRAGEEILSAHSPLPELLLGLLLNWNERSSFLCYNRRE